MNWMYIQILRKIFFCTWPDSFLNERNISCLTFSMTLSWRSSAYSHRFLYRFNQSRTSRLWNTWGIPENQFVVWIYIWRRADIDQWKSVNVVSYWKILPLQLLLFIFLFQALTLSEFPSGRQIFLLKSDLTTYNIFSGLEKDVIEFRDRHARA